MERRSFSGNKLYRRASMLLLGGIALLSSCSNNPDISGKPSDNELEFMRNSNAVSIAVGQMERVGNINQANKSQYDKTKKVSQNDNWGSNRDNSIGDRPFRYELGFRPGDGSSTDMACEKLTLPDGTKYVFATKNDTEDAWVSVSPDGDFATICYDVDKIPGDVLAWASSESR